MAMLDGQTPSSQLSRTFPRCLRFTPPAPGGVFFARAIAATCRFSRAPLNRKVRFGQLTRSLGPVRFESRSRLLTVRWFESVIAHRLVSCPDACSDRLRDEPRMRSREPTRTSRDIGHVRDRLGQVDEMKKKQARSSEIVVCAIDVVVIVLIAALAHHGSIGDFATLRIEAILTGVSALLAAFLLRLAGIGLDGRRLPATRHALRTLALWLVVQGFVFVKMVALTTVTMVLMKWFLDWTTGVAIALVAFRIALCIARRRSLRAPVAPATVAIVGSGERIAQIRAELRASAA
ncbi:hypothetical protein F7R13_07625, partial [Burkholderia territorii]